MEQMLEVAEKMQEDQGTLEELHKRTSSMERERERVEPVHRMLIMMKGE